MRKVLIGLGVFIVVPIIAVGLISYFIGDETTPDPLIGYVAVGFFLLPIVGFIWAMRLFWRWQKTFHNRMKTQGLF